VTDKARVEALQRQLTEQVEAIQSGADWRRMLDFAARFHRYSVNNQLLIRIQHEAAFRRGLVSDPQPTYVAGFYAWKALGRSVEKGQKGYAVLAPTPYHARVAVVGVGPGGARRPLARSEEPRTDERVAIEQRLAWRIEHVFDVSQTSGTPVPQPPRPQPLIGQAPDGLVSGLTRFATDRGYTVGYVPDAPALGGADGITRFDKLAITIREDMAGAAIASTLAHEVGHMLLHDPKRDPAGAATHRGVGEVEAESVAYIVAAAHGMDTAPDSLPYVTTWAGSRQPAIVVQATAQRVIRAAHDVLTALDTVQLGDGAPPGLAAAVALRADRSASRDIAIEAGVPDLAIGT